MDPATLLDLLGNENRRKIIQLLANRPCYVSEISGRLGVGPKAIINHLSLLEQAGMIEFSIDEQRRKYFNIVNNMRLEVSVSPYSYSVSLHDVQPDSEPEKKTAEQKVREKIEKTGIEIPDSASLFLELNENLKKIKMQHEELARRQRKLQADYTELMDLCLDSIEAVARSSVECEILLGLMKKELSTAALCYQLRLPPSLINSNLLDLAERGFIEYTIRNNQQYWKIREKEEQKKI
ncbi:MAG: ArsR family transcriptional regulator [Methanosarcinaceae archaeon]|nr:ArsR family transcriptional regulator [Methanosarcinaceae archaeon]MDD4332219.1 ArsR family transcriptional regulator [Methanosarcinaceae archaeon]MDD4749207.1 ArsR family transcriptional regulator [Methanosarcinaceae archaeon]